VNRILAIDPGSSQSGWVVLDDGQPGPFGISANALLLDLLRIHDVGPLPPFDELVIEQIKHMGTGMPVGAEVFETVFWSGRFAEAAHPTPLGRIGNMAIRVHLCGSARAKDPNVRQALIDRYGGESAIGRKATPGPLYGITSHVWAALAVAVAWSEGAR